MTSSFKKVWIYDRLPFLSTINVFYLTSVFGLNFSEHPRKYSGTTLSLKYRRSKSWNLLLIELLLKMRGGLAVW